MQSPVFTQSGRGDLNALPLGPRWSLPGLNGRPTSRADSVPVSPSSRTNTNDRLPRPPLGRVEGGDGIAEGRDGPDVRPQASLPARLDYLTHFGTIGLHNPVHR